MNSGDSEAKKFYLQSLQEHLVLLDKQIKDASAKIINLGDTIEEKEKDKIERNNIVEKSRKRKLKQLIPSFASDGNGTAKERSSHSCN
jgi:intein/homing endonuclease